MSLIDGALVPAEECLKTTTEALRNRRNLTYRSTDSILDNLRRAVYAFHDFTSRGIEAAKLRVENFAGFGDHTFDPPELIARRYADLRDVRRSRPQILRDALNRRHQLAGLIHEALNLFRMTLGH